MIEIRKTTQKEKAKHNNMAYVIDLGHTKQWFTEKALVELLDKLHKVVKNNAVLQHVINWVAIADEKPKTEWGDFLICLENNSIHKANYSTIAGERWLVVGVREICEENPVKYWAELPKPPYL